MFENSLISNTAMPLFTQKGAIGNICVKYARFYTLRLSIHIRVNQGAIRLLLVKLGQCKVIIFKLRQN